MKKRIMLLLAALMALLSCAEIGNEFDNPWDPNGTKYNEKGNDISKYKTVKIGTQTWMAENLDYAIAGSACYNNRSSNCAKYGRLYTWDAANRACPSGWHLPSDAEWTKLTDDVGGASTAGTKLKAASGWNSGGNGTDQYGFSALPGGYGLSGGDFDYAGYYGYWWSATEDNATNAWRRSMHYDNNYVEDVLRGSFGKTDLFSVRCVETTPPEEEGYSISIVNGTMVWDGDTTTSGVLYESDVAIVLSANPPAGKVFDEWDVSPTTARASFANRSDSSTTFTMPAYNVVITAKFKDGVVEPEGYIISISGGTMYWEDDPENQITDGEMVFLEDDVAIILSADSSAEGREFDYWDVSPTTARIFFENRYDPNTKFTMPDYDVEITANFMDIDEDGWYTISTFNGTMEWWADISDPTSMTPLNNGDILFKDDVVIVLSATPESGQTFERWTVSPSRYEINFNNVKDERTTFRMPAADVVITAVFRDFEPGKAEVRFTWEAAENENISHISASVEDMEWWKEEIYADLKNFDNYFTAIPLHDGNPGVTANIFNYGSANHPNKGRYWSTEAGSFTAVCGVEDEYGFAEIVANYTITINPASADGKDLYFEIAFDVGTFLSEPNMDEYAWFQNETENPNRSPRLEKKKAYKIGVTRVATKQYKKPGATVDVTYYVIRRPKV